MQDTFLQAVIKRFEQYKDLGDDTFKQLRDEDFFFTPEGSNSIAVIVQHMYGNMLSRWTNFLTEDGEKPWRKRDAEFEPQDCTKEDLISFWNEGWKCLLDTLRSLTPEDLDKTIYIRTEPLVAYDAILRQVAHYAYHVGQIVYIGKLAKGTAWNSLSIARGASAAFNEHMKNKQ